jgi:hypothetical protein
MGHLYTFLALFAQGLLLTIEPSFDLTTLFKASLL